MGPFRFLLYAVHSGPRFHPLGERFLQLIKAHCISQTRVPPYEIEDTPHSWSGVDGA